MSDKLLTQATMALGLRPASSRPGVATHQGDEPARWPILGDHITKRTGGRWNEKGTSVVYAADSRALACLETMVHLGAGNLPFNRYLVALAIPGGLWAAAEAHTPSSLLVGWDAQPAGRVSIAFGTAWLRSGRSGLLVVPLAIVPEEANVLVNPRHPGSAAIGPSKVRRWLCDPRLAR